MTRRLDTPWRRLAIAVFDAPRTGDLFVQIQVNVGPLEAYLAGRDDLDPVRDLPFFVLAALGRALADDAPSLNAFIERGRVRARDGVTVSMTTPPPSGAGVMTVRLHDAHRRPATDLAAAVRARMAARRERAAGGRQPGEYGLARVPWPFRRPLFRALRGLAELGVPLGRLDLAPESYGAFVVSNLAPVIADYPEGQGAASAAFGPTFPATRDASLLALLPPEAVPVVVDGEIVVQRRMPLSFTVDHRLADAREIGALARGTGVRLLDPAALDEAL